MGDVDLWREVELRKHDHPGLHGNIDPHGVATGWMVFQVPWSSDAGPSAYTFTVRDELNIDYVATGESALPRPAFADRRHEVELPAAGEVTDDA